MGKINLKRRKRKRARFNHYTFQAIILTFISLFAYKAATGGGLENLTKFMRTANVPEASEELQVHFVDVEQGDCIVLTCEGETMLIDAGNNRYGETVVDYLEYLKVDKLEYVVATHPDADHIGGIDTVLKSFGCDEVWMTDDTKDTMTYEEVVDIIKKNKIEKRLPEVGESVELGCALVTVLAPVEEYENANENSIMLMVQHGEKKFLFTGDAEEQEMKDVCHSGADIDADVYKASHHGSRDGMVEAFLDEVSPEYAVISCGEGNSYGHPHAAVLNYLRSDGVSVFRTDEQGTIVAESDGDMITWNCSPSDSWNAGEAGQ